MSAIWIGVGSAVVSAGVGLYGANQSKKASDRALAQQKAMAGDSLAFQMAQLGQLQEAIAAFQEQAMALAEESKTEIRGARDTNIATINAIPEVRQLMGQAENLSRRDFDFRTEIQRENLDFIVGETGDELRDAQQLNASLAALDSSDLQGRMSDIVKSSMFGLRADTIGDAYGTFANLSAQNLYNFSQQGLSNTLALNDFFSREGTVDPVSPLQTAFELRTVAEREASMQIQNQQWSAGAIADVNASLTGSLGSAIGMQGSAVNSAIGASQYGLSQSMDISNAGLVAQQQQNQAYMQALSQVAQGAFTYYGLNTQRQAMNQQQSYQLANNYTGSNYNLATTGQARYSLDYPSAAVYQ